MEISLVSLDDYHEGSQGFMKHLRLAGCLMARSLASLEGYHGGSQHEKRKSFPTRTTDMLERRRRRYHKPPLLYVADVINFTLDL